MGNEALGHRTRWNLVGEVRERLDGQNGFQFAEELGLFLKGGMRRKEVEFEEPKRKLANALQKKKKKPAVFQITVFQITYDQSRGLSELIECAVGRKNFGNINSDITQEHFPLKGTDVRMVNVRVEPIHIEETCEEAARRLIAVGHTLANTGDLAGFLFDHPKEVEKWSWVSALSGDSRWASPKDGIYMVPCASVSGARRGFGLGRFRLRFGSGGGGVLILC